MRSAKGRILAPSEHVKWETGLQIGDMVEARWTRRYGCDHWKAKARIFKFNLCSCQVLLEEEAGRGAVGSAYPHIGWKPGCNLTLPLCYYNGPLRYSGGREIYKQGARIQPSKWSETNCIAPLE